MKLSRLKIDEDVLQGLRNEDPTAEIFVVVPMLVGEILLSIEKTGLEDNQICPVIHEDCCGHAEENS